MNGDQNAILHLIREDPDAAEFFSEFYPDWRDNPEEAATALEELRDFGAIT